VIPAEADLPGGGAICPLPALVGGKIFLSVLCSRPVGKGARWFSSGLWRQRQGVVRKIL